ncbi:TRAP transporter large permease [Vreelandella titanicae]|uniref:TRAP transporter large permease protein n=1 Tax=Vreelandella titanicae BH1 TaxID=1204738 RepID=L9U5S1_9GAMM|nr:TRAP transporter large permease [Halomonas titanicae]ELY20219.1 TRAP C4-dicarboxylate transport system permease DctM subunit [Halomonas titanicae BH1]
MFAAIIGFIVAFLLIFARVPVAMALGLVGFMGYVWLLDWSPAITMLTLTTSSNTLNYNLAVIPLFILMGNLIAGAGVSMDLYRAAQAFIGRRRGGLALATIVSSGGFAAVCGSSVATAVTMGRIAIPSMRQYGYADSLSTATVAAGATLGILIPPSIIMVIYGIATETSIGHLFAAGVIPGILGVIGYMFAVKLAVILNPAAAPPSTASSFREKMTALRKTWLVGLLFAVVLGGIYAGIFTATEAGGIGASGALLVAMFRKVDIRNYYLIFKDTAQTTAMLFAILIGAHAFSEFINLTGADRMVLEMVTASGLAPWMTIGIILLIYIFLGCLLDSLAMMLLTLPMFFPVVMGLGYDPVWFGIVIVMVIELALITPPMGMNLFIVRAVAPEVPLITIIKGITPFVLLDLARVLLIVAFPVIALWLPNYLFN